MNDTAARVLMCLALLPLSAATFILPLAASARISGTFNEYQVICASATATWAVGVVWLWRRHIPWTRSRIGATVGLTALVVGQLVAWRPLWSMSGCAEEDILRCAQSFASAGAWLFGCVLSWWGWSILRRTRRREPAQEGRRAMTSNAVRLMLSLALAPWTLGLYFIAEAAADRFLGSTGEVDRFVGWQTCTISLCGFWLLIWHRAVEWTPPRVRGTALLAGLTLASPGITLLPAVGFPDLLCDLAPLFAITGWTVGTALLWRSSGVTRHALPPAPAIEHLVRCLRCDYSLIGLRETRCPECGWTTTIDGVVARALAAATGPDI